MEETDNSSNTDKPWLFKKGQSGNPGGRPKGKSLKDYTREMLAAMTDEERQTFLEGIPKIDIFKMAEGNPESKTDITSAGKPIIQLAREVALKYDIPSVPVDNSQE